MARNPRWQRNELILALDLYVRSGMIDDTHPDVIALSEILNRMPSNSIKSDPTTFRNPNGVAMKLANFAALDPTHPGKALERGGKLDAEIFNEFIADRGRLISEATRIRSELLLDMPHMAAGAVDLSSPEIIEAREAIAERAGKVRHGQGYRVDPVVKRLIELHAMERARLHYEGLGWQVTDVSVGSSYDLHCKKLGSHDLRVEIKGTTTDGRSILLTPNEVKHAQQHFPHVALFIVANIKLIGDPTIPGAMTTSEGDVLLFDPWQLNNDCLTPLGFEYVIPSQGGGAKA